MKFLLLISLGCYIVTCIHLATASPYANTDPEANADPDPLVGTRIKKTCEASMGNATTHEVLCEKAAKHVVDKVAKACHKAFKYGCTLITFAVDYDSCYAKMESLICPANKPPTVEIEGEENTTATKTPSNDEKQKVNSVTTEAPKSDAEHPSWIGRVIIKRCKNYLKPIADNITENGQQPFQTEAFCKQLGHAGRDTCVAAIVGQCDYFPKGWDAAKGICKDYIIPWICK